MQKSFRTTLGVMALLVLPMVSHRALAQDQTGALLSGASTALAQGKNEEAIHHYEELLKAGNQNALMHYNLGIAYYRSGAFGKAIFHFKTAARLVPRDGDIKFNLSFARKKAVDKIEDNRVAAVSAAEKLMFFSEREIWYALGIAVFVCAVLSSALLWNKQDLLRFVQRLAVAAVVICALVLGVRSYGDQPFGVVTATAADVYSGKGQNNVLLFTLHDGAEFNLDGAPAQDWIKIVLKDGKKGWIRASDVIY